MIVKVTSFVNWKFVDWGLLSSMSVSVKPPALSNPGLVLELEQALAL